MKLHVLLMKRTVQFSLLALLVATATFLLSTLIPGDFYSARELDPMVSRETIGELRRQHGLDLPVHVQYLRWLGGALRLDLGHSLHFQAPVAVILGPALLNTLWLGIPALAAGILLGAALGSAHALCARKAAGAALDLLATVALSLPSLVLGLAALLVAARTGWFPMGGTESPVMTDPTAAARALDRLHHLALPLFCLTFPIAAYVERIQFAATQGYLQSPAIHSARARGLSRARIFTHYLLRPSLNPVLSVSGPLFGAVLSGSLILEVLFAWPGLGQVTYDALFSHDLFLLLGCVMASSLLLIAGNILADLLLYLLDPRTRAALRSV
ncbi:MAG: ABC transporter permease [Acidobacteriota bacterium]